MSLLKRKDKEKIRIAVYGHKSIPSREGGIEVVVQEMAVRMAALGYSVTCLNRGGKHEIYEDRNEVKDGSFKGVKLEAVPTIDRSGLAAATSSFFAAWKSAFGAYDVVHIHAEGPAAFCWIPKLFGKKIIVTVHGLDWKRDKWHGFARDYIHYGERMAVAYADEIIVLSKEMRQYFLNEYNRDTVYIPNGLTCAEKVLPNLIRSEFGLEKDGYILYLGRLVPEKKADVLIEAYKRTRTDKKLVIAGPDSETDEYIMGLHDLAGDDPRIIFTGFVKGRVFEELMSNAYVYTLPSKLEGMPLSLLEALSYGNCCITSDIPECKEVLGTHGLLVEPEKVDQLQNALQILSDHPEMVERFRKEALALAESFYSWDDVSSRTLTLYEDIFAAVPEKAEEAHAFTPAAHQMKSRV